MCLTLRSSSSLDEDIHKNTAYEMTAAIKESECKYEEVEQNHAYEDIGEQNHVYEDIGDQKIASTKGEYPYSKGVSDLLKTEYPYSKGVPDFLKMKGAAEREYPYSKGVPDFPKTESAMEREYPNSKGVPDFIQRDVLNTPRLKVLDRDRIIIGKVTDV